MAYDYDIVACGYEDVPHGYLRICYGDAKGNVYPEQDNGRIVTIPYSSSPRMFSSAEALRYWLNESTILTLCSMINEVDELDECDTLIFVWHSIDCLNDEPIVYARCIDDEWDIIDY